MDALLPLEIKRRGCIPGVDFSALKSVDVVSKPLRRKSTHDSHLNNAVKKPYAYEALSVLNQHFEHVLQNLDRLRELGLFDTQFRRASLQACQATIRRDLRMDQLRSRRDSTRLGRA